MDIPVILYGAGRLASSAYSLLKSKYNIVCLADGDICKHGIQYSFPDNVSLPVLSLTSAVKQYPAAKLWITPSPPVKYEIIYTLMHDFNIEKEKIINFEPVTKRISCTPAEEMLVFADGHIQTCCMKEDVPICHYDNNISNIEFTEMLNEYKNKISQSLHKEKYPYECIGCHQIKEAIWPDQRICSEVILISGSMCQFKCVYCNNDERTSKLKQHNLSRTLELINHLKETGYITSKTHVSISNGEITINPL